MDNHETAHWSEGLPPVIFAINTRTTATAKKTPYQLVFGQDPRADYHHWREVHDASLSGIVEIDDLQIESVKQLTEFSTNKRTRSVSFSSAMSPSKKCRARSRCEISLAIKSLLNITSLATNDSLSHHHCRQVNTDRLKGESSIRLFGSLAPADEK